MARLCPIMPTSTLASLGSVWALDGGRVSTESSGRLGTTGVGGEFRRVGDKHVRGRGSSMVLVAGLEIHSSRVRGAGAPSMRSERGVVVMMVEQMIRGDGMVRIASGCLL